jgi:hypothetical protein
VEMVKRDTPGIAIGGLSGGEAKTDFCKVYARDCRPATAIFPLCLHYSIGLIRVPACSRRRSQDMSWVLYGNLFRVYGCGNR